MVEGVFNCKFGFLGWLEMPLFNSLFFTILKYSVVYFNTPSSTEVHTSNILSLSSPKTSDLVWSVKHRSSSTARSRDISGKLQRLASVPDPTVDEVTSSEQEPCYGFYRERFGFRVSQTLTVFFKREWNRCWTFLVGFRVTATIVIKMSPSLTEEEAMKSPFVHRHSKNIH
ncbi:hypothetical protein SASPL_120023 [Salvia splendens]|uniref:Uncharacterized protein n=1 Tax=Salvia splendens TaxID=180675 RepID=A0A8X8XRP3_SALSN|nr:hypothetical protein SASPL_120023 [Salvia splendens]